MPLIITLLRQQIVLLQNEVLSHSEREYFIDLATPALIKNVSARGSIVLQPFQAQAEAHHVLVRLVHSFHLH